MNILVTESEPGDAAELIDQLRRHGHHVDSCASDTGAPCVGLQVGGRCPLDERGFAVMVDVRRAGRPRLSVHEYGALCALRQELPLVVVGPSGADHPLPWAHAVVEVFGEPGEYDVAAAVEAVERVGAVVEVP